MAEEKEAATLSRAFTSVEYLLFIHRWAEAHLHQKQVYVVGIQELSEQLPTVQRDLKVCLYVLGWYLSWLVKCYARSNECFRTDRQSATEVLFDVFLLFVWIPRVELFYLDLPDAKGNILQVIAVDEVRLIIAIKIVHTHA